VLAKTQTAPDTGAYVTLADAQAMLKDQLPPAIRDNIDTTIMATNITVYGKPGVNLDTLAAKINSEVPGVKAAKPSDIVSSFRAGGAIFTGITTGAALLALVIGGLSVINTMIMAVTERIREIGLKKALGAHTGQILSEYLLEATVIGLIGNLVGFALGFTLTTLLNLAGAATNLELFLVTPGLAVVAIGFAVALGALAGVAPAFRASRLDPVTALRTQS
jgi:putative ABC transport system permease protein